MLKALDTKGAAREDILTGLARVAARAKAGKLRAVLVIEVPWDPEASLVITDLGEYRNLELFGALEIFKMQMFANSFDPPEE